MAVKTYTAIREYAFDQSRVCENCSHQYTFAWRVFGQGSDTVMFSAKAARSRAQSNAEQIGLMKAMVAKEVSALAWQRCPNCGLYSTRDIQNISKSLPAFRRQQRGRWLVLLAGSATVLFAAVLLVAGIIDEVQGNPGRLPVWGVIGIVGFFCAAGSALIWWGRWLGSPARFHNSISTLNEPKRVATWLATWQKHGASALEKVLAERNTPDQWNYAALDRYRYNNDRCVSPAWVHPKDIART
jgi:hypothetical protein